MLIMQNEIREWTNHERLLTIGKNLRVAGGEGVGNGGMGGRAFRRARDVTSTGCRVQLMRALGVVCS